MGLGWAVAIELAETIGKNEHDKEDSVKRCVYEGFGVNAVLYSMYILFPML